MPYKFKSRATADLIMLDANGRKLLEIIGKSPDEVHGIITVEQIPAAIAALEAAAAEEAVRRKQPEGGRIYQVTSLPSAALRLSM